MPTFLLPDEPVTSLDAYLATDIGGLGIERAQRIGPAATIEAVLASGLRGRGGGGFPTGRKWAGLAAQAGTRRYVVCNGAEGEPGTFKDRALIRANPYQVVEGVIIAAFAVGAAETFICLKRSFEREIDAVTRAVQEFQSAGICTDCQVTIVAGPDEYLFGEEKAMLEVIEGKPPLPRWYPPYEHGLFATAPQLGWEATPRSGSGGGPNPTLVNNVETLANVPHILARGAEWFRSMGTPESPGTIVATVVGDVIAPDVGEVELGTSLRDVIDGVGSGIAPGRSVKAVFSGVANPVVVADQLDVPVSYEGFQAIGSGMGAAGFIVYDDTTCMVDAAYRLSRFLSIESCGQCPPCKLGSSEITNHLERLEIGGGSDDDLRSIRHWLARVTDGNRCYLAVEEQLVVDSIMQAFPDEFAEHVELGRCPRPRRLPIPKLVDLADGRPPTTRRSGGSAPTGPTNPTSEVLSEPAARRARAGCRPDRDRTFDPCSFPDADGTNVPPVTHRANLVAAPAMASSRPAGLQGIEQLEKRAKHAGSKRAGHSELYDTGDGGATDLPSCIGRGEPVPGRMSASSKCRRRTRPGTTPHTTGPAPGPPGPKCRTCARRRSMRRGDSPLVRARSPRRRAGNAIRPAPTVGAPPSSQRGRPRLRPSGALMRR